MNPKHIKLARLVIRCGGLYSREDGADGAAVRKLGELKSRQKVLLLLLLLSCQTDSRCSRLPCMHGAAPRKEGLQGASSRHGAIFVDITFKILLQNKLNEIQF